jgi:hypothetical protein
MNKALLEDEYPGIFFSYNLLHVSNLVELKIKASYHKVKG